MLHHDTVGQVMDRYMVEKFIIAAGVSARKMRLYTERAEQSEVRRHLNMMAEANDNAIKQLEGLLPKLS